MTLDLAQPWKPGPAAPPLAQARTQVERPQSECGGKVRCNRNPEPRRTPPSAFMLKWGNMQAHNVAQ